MLTDWLIESIEQQIDKRTGRTWLAGPVTGERHEIQSNRVWLRQRPVTAVSAVRLGPQFTTPTLLVVNTDYVLDATRGLLTFSTGWRGEVEVDYTVPSTIPADIMQAATLWAAGSLTGGSAAAGQAGIYKRISTDGQTLEYRDAGEVGAPPDAVERILACYSPLVLA